MAHCFFDVVLADQRIPGRSSIQDPLNRSNDFLIMFSTTLFAASAWPFIWGQEIAENKPRTVMLSWPTVELPSIIQNEDPWDTEVGDEVIQYEVLDLFVCDVG